MELSVPILPALLVLLLLLFLSLQNCTMTEALRAA